MKQEERGGILAQFETPEALLNASRQAYKEGYRQMDAYAPYYIEGLAESMGRGRTAVPGVFLAAGILGALLTFVMQYYIAKIDYPINVGGRPLNSWPAFIPVTFELAVLFAGIAGFIAMLMMNRLPEPYHAVFNSEAFTARASTDRYYLYIEAADPRFELQSTMNFLRQLNAEEVSEIGK